MEKTLQTLPEKNPLKGKKIDSPLLYFLFSADDVLREPARHMLAGLNRVILGRAERRTAERLSSELRLGFPDWHMSGWHASLSATSSGRWAIVDGAPAGAVAPSRGSLNGTYVNGVRITKADLRDGDIIELGHSFFLYRSAVSMSASDLADEVVLPPGKRLAGLTTLVPELGERFRSLHKIAARETTIIIVGETGTGKERLARALHQLASRRGEFVAIECAKLSAALGRGSLTGAIEDRPGLLRRANHGTLFIDEIADLSNEAQQALLGFLAEKSIVLPGSAQSIKLDISVCAATRHDLSELVGQQRFRADLLSQMEGFTIHLPTLAARRADLGLLVADLLVEHAPHRSQSVCFTKAAVLLLLFFPWPRNIRQLEKCLTRALTLSEGDPCIDVEHLDLSSRPIEPIDNPPEPPRLLLTPDEELEKVRFEKLWIDNGENVTRVAAIVGKSRTAVRKKLKRYGIMLP